MVQLTFDKSLGTDDELLKPPRRATSPVPRSPTWSLFPSTSKSERQSARRSLGMRKASPLQRSHTAPTTLSPDRVAFDKLVGTAADFLDECQSTEDDGRSTEVVTPATISDHEEAEVPPVPPVPVGESDSKTSIDESAWEMVTTAAGLESREAMELERMEDTDPALTQISIARKVSVTRARRQLVRPLGIEPERLVDRQALTPVLVESRDRRSQRVQFENA